MFAMFGPHASLAPVRHGHVDVFVFESTGEVRAASEWAAIAAAQGDLLKSHDAGEVRLVDGKWLVKSWHARPLLTRCYHRLRFTPAWRQWRGAARLRSIGVCCSAPVALVHDRRSGRQTLVLPYVRGVTLHQFVADAQACDAAQRQRVAAQIGRQIGRIAAAGWINRDHKPSNLILDDNAQQGLAEPVIIDTAAIQARRHDRQVVRMLAIMDRALARAGAVSDREKLRCVREVLRADPPLAARRRQRLRWLLQQVRAMREARPLSYDPVTLEPLKRT